MAYQHDGQWPQTGDKPARWETQAAAMAVAAVAIFLALATVLPGGLVVPAFAVIAMMAGAGIALYAWMIGVKQERGRITTWDLANSCIFLGFAAGVLGDPQHVMDLTSTLTASRQ